MEALWIFLMVVTLSSAEDRVSYQGYHVVDVKAKTQQAVDFLHHIEDSPGLLFEGHISLGPHPLQIAIAPDMWPEMETWFKLLSIDYTIMISNLGELIQEEQKRLDRKRDYDPNDFNDLAQITERLEYIVTECAPGLSCELLTAGTTYEGRDIPLIKMSSGAGKQAVWLDSTIHAREWLATATTMRILEHMVSTYGSDDDITRIMDAFDWYVAPVVNPDGYFHTWDVDRMWRKNRRPFTCVGVDLNRNFDYELWGNEGTSSNSCSNTYSGPSPASENETQAVQSQVEAINNLQTVLALVTVHTYGRMWQHPWGHTLNHAGDTCVEADDHDDMFAVAQAAAEAVMAVGGQVWTYGTSCEIMYPTTGMTSDWAKAVPGIKYPFLLELRGSNFVISPTEIQISFQEIFAGLVAMVDAITILEN